MAKPKGSLTAAQYEIMGVVWSAGAAGASVADIWQQIGRARTIGRTTVLNQVDRLEKRGWLRRVPGDGAIRFTATVRREEASRRLAASFVADYFEGSAANLVSTLLGNEALALGAEELRRLRELLEQAEDQRPGSK
jgi:predicted transcriptional regulator